MSRESAAVPGTRIIGIGASAGGVEALKTFFGSMPPDSGMAFLIVLHLAPDRDSLLAEILGHSTKMPVVQATDGIDVTADHVYVIAPGTVLSYADGRLGVSGSVTPHRQPNPVDLLFSSLAVALGDKAVGIVLSGTGSDGALGLKAIRDGGGIAMAQGRDGSASYFEGMPNAATAVGAVDMFLPVAAMPERLLSLLACPPPPVDDLPPLGSATAMDGYRASICAILRNQIGHDFSGYKPATFLRRVQRRMQLFALGIEDYIQCLAGDPQEVALLFHELLIGVTKFFRDPATFDRLAQTGACRICSTGRVPMNGAHLGAGLRDRRGSLFARDPAARAHGDVDRSAPQVQIFATDIDEAAIGPGARRPLSGGCWCGMSRLSGWSGSSPSSTAHYVSRQARCATLCTFSAHSVIRDPPFSRHRPDLLPQSSDLSRRRIAGAGDPRLPLRAGAGRLSVAGRFGDGDAARRAVRAARQDASHFPAPRCATRLPLACIRDRPPARRRLPPRAPARTSGRSGSCPAQAGARIACWNTTPRPSSW